MAQILQNAVQISYNGEISYLVSRNRHDFQRFDFENGDYYYVDGGHEYIRRGGNIPQNAFVMEISLSDDCSYEIIKNWLLWGTNGKSGKEPFHWVKLSDCATDHLQAILTFRFPKGTRIHPLHEKVITDLLKERNASLQSSISKPRRNKTKHAAIRRRNKH